MTVGTSCSWACRDKGTEKVVGLVALGLEDGYVKCLHQLSHTVELGAEFRRRRGPLRLVLGEHLVAEGGGGQVECDSAVGGMVVLDGAQEGVGEAVDAGDVLAGGADGEVAADGDGAVGAVHQGVAVDEDQPGAFVDWHQWGTGTSAPPSSSHRCQPPVRVRSLYARNGALQGTTRMLGQVLLL